jgi:hypothetical protein
VRVLEVSGCFRVADDSPKTSSFKNYKRALLLEYMFDVRLNPCRKKASSMDSTKRVGTNVRETALSFFHPNPYGEPGRPSLTGEGDSR